MKQKPYPFFLSRRAASVRQLCDTKRCFQHIPLVDIKLFVMCTYFYLACCLAFGGSCNEFVHTSLAITTKGKNSADVAVILFQDSFVTFTVQNVECQDIQNNKLASCRVSAVPYLKYQFLWEVTPRYGWSGNSATPLRKPENSPHRSSTPIENSRQNYRVMSFVPNRFSQETGRGVVLEV